MVRSEGNSSGEEAPRKKQRRQSGAVWPCEMHGCTKQFAREADLKRHQRTTKLHSKPNFACPQCDAAFTRADALRRHQKARHTGVTAEAATVDRIDAELSGHEDGPEATSGSNSRSRSASPVAKRTPKEKKPRQQKSKPGPSELTRVGASASHYRQHTKTMSASYPPRKLDGQYGLSLPTSSTRVNQLNRPTSEAPERDSSPSHAESSAQGRSQYPPISHRTSDIAPPTKSPPAREPPPHRTWSKIVIRSPSPPQLLIPPPEAHGVASNGHFQRIKNDKSENERHRDPDDMYVSSPGRVGHVPRPRSITPTARYMRRGASSHGYEPNTGRPKSMEHILTENGERMLNPAELLTQA